MESPRLPALSPNRENETLMKVDARCAQSAVFARAQLQTLRIAVAGQHQAASLSRLARWLRVCPPKPAVASRYTPSGWIARYSRHSRKHDRNVHTWPLLQSLLLERPSPCRPSCHGPLHALFVNLLADHVDAGRCNNPATPAAFSSSSSRRKFGRQQHPALRIDLRDRRRRIRDERHILGDFRVLARVLETDSRWLSRPKSGRFELAVKSTVVMKTLSAPSVFRYARNSAGSLRRPFSSHFAVKMPKGGSASVAIGAVCSTAQSGVSRLPGSHFNPL